MAANFDFNLVRIRPQEMIIDFPLLIGKIFDAFRVVKRISFDFTSPIEEIKEKKICCKVSSDELFEHLKTEEDATIELFTEILTKYLNWRIFFIRYFNQKFLPELIDLQVENLQNLSPDKESALSSILNFEQLEVLTIRRSSLEDSKELLQFWNLTSLRVLVLNSNLKALPASIGMLSKLEMLNINNNSITPDKVPFTLLNCERLHEFHCQSAAQHFLPFIIQKLPSLKFFTNTDSRFLDRVNRNIKTGIVKATPTEQRKLFKPLPLQILSSEVVLERDSMCWKNRSLAPLLCRVLDRALERCQLCFVCNNVYSDANGGFILESVLPTFLGASVVAFRQWCCSDKCLEIAKAEQKDLNASLKLAQELEMTEVANYYKEELEMIGYKAPSKPRPTPRRNEKCRVS